MSKYSENHIISAGLENAINNSNDVLLEDIIKQHGDLVDFTKIRNLMFVWSEQLNTHVVWMQQFIKIIKYIPSNYLTDIIKLNCVKKNLTELNLPYLPNLEILNCSQNNLKELDISMLPRLKSLTSDLPKDRIIGNLNDIIILTRQ